MVLSDIESYKNVFYAYARKFRVGGSVDLESIDHKIAHSLRVFEYAKTIVSSLDLGSSCARVALLAALFHDIGRFPQYGIYGTFIDRRSQNHGLLGAITVRGEHFFQDIAADEERIITGAVMLHNRKGIPKHISRKLSLVIRIVRDADKLDIMPYVLGNLHADSSQHPAKTLGLELHPTAYTETIYNDVMNGGMGKYAEMRFVHDFTITMCGWVHDFNFTETRRLCLERGYVDQLLGHLPETPAMKALGDRVKETLRAQSCKKYQI